MTILNIILAIMFFIILTVVAHFYRKIGYAEGYDDGINNRIPKR